MGNHVCASCGEIIPYGRDLCWGCEHGYTPNTIIKTKEGDKDDVRVFERAENEVSAKS